MAAFRARHVEVAWRDGKLEKVTEATTRGLGLDLYVDGRYASVGTSDLRPEALERFVADSVALARTLAPDPHRRLPGARALPGPVAGGPRAWRTRPTPRSTPAARRQAAEAIEAAARVGRGRRGDPLGHHQRLGQPRRERARPHQRLRGHAAAPPTSGSAPR